MQAWAGFLFSMSKFVNSMLISPEVGFVLFVRVPFQSRYSFLLWGSENFDPNKQTEKN